MKLFLLTIALLGTTANATSNAGTAPASRPFATCYEQSGVGDVIPRATYAIYIVGSPISPELSEIERSVGEFSMDMIRVSAKFGFHTWTTYLVRFAGAHGATTIQFSQSMSPSIGELIDERGSQQVVCELSRGGFK